ncbi:MAG: hypothetical protein NZ524_07900 [Thiobacillaceae bacterium]|nr:hypothetical protein [Thiobacillaceae bacterium]MCX7672795.1 hypothetical protein [Thiobacillaceae bacterium]MDW8323087.1 hypothetical protein [Burkholderiales bacterium]
MQRWVLVGLSLVALTGCERVYERLGFPDPARVQAEGKAIGGACRHAGRGLEDCYTLNPGASKAAIYEGWKEMNEYMAKTGLQEVAPQIDPRARGKTAKAKTAEQDEQATSKRDEEADAEMDKG